MGIDNVGGQLFVVGCPPTHCRTFSILGSCPLKSNSVPHHRDNQKYLYLLQTPGRCGTSFLHGESLVYSLISFLAIVLPSYLPENTPALED